MQHSVVAKEAGRFKAWPANGGLWSWGEEVLAMYYDGTADYSDPHGHTVNRTQLLWTEQARSRDGGKTWTIERHPLPFPTPGTIADLTTPLDFSDPDHILCFKMEHWEYSQSYLYHSENRGRTWQGPFRLPTFGRATVNARTCYVTEGTSDCLAWLSGGYHENRREDGYETFLIRSRDGGLTWQEQGRPCRATLPCENDQRRFTIMPSVVRLPAGDLVCLTRCLESTATPPHWVEAWHSHDDGATWQFLSRVDTPGASTPPAVCALPDGTLALTYGYRTPPYGIRARTSGDGGRTWSEEIVLREDGGNWDLGYTRNVTLPGDTVLAVYYFNRDTQGERSIEATCWDPHQATS